MATPKEAKTFEGSTEMSRLSRVFRDIDATDSKYCFKQTKVTQIIQIEPYKHLNRLNLLSPTA